MASAAICAPSWGAPLQEKFLPAHTVACCPAMDLIAVITLDRQLLVHRTISWQRVLHVRPSEVDVVMHSLAWSPDGARLAVGCAQGQILVYTIENGDAVTLEAIEAQGEEGDQNEQHVNAHGTSIVTMHWVAARARTPVVPTDSNGHVPMHMSSIERENVLVSADQDGTIWMWWDGCVPIAGISLVSHIPADTSASTVTTSCSIEAVRLTTNFAALYAVVRTGTDADGSAQVRKVMRLDLSKIAEFRQEISTMAHTTLKVHAIMKRLEVAARQMRSEWKNALRIFELKMGLLGSLYEKYDREDLPQMDMIAALVGGIASPALAQFFAQDIQEMSIVRMQKMLTSGCDAINKCVEEQMKRGLRELLFQLMELRGDVSWRSMAYTKTMGIERTPISDLIERTARLLTDMEILGKTLEESRLDLCLLLEWMLERIHVHTNSVDQADGSRRGGGSVGARNGKSMLNIRRLSAFLERAAESARIFRDRQDNKYKLDGSFGNAVSQYFSSSQLESSLASFNQVWSHLLTRMECSLSASVQSNPTRTLWLGYDADEICLHSREEVFRSDDEDADHVDTNTDMSDPDDGNDAESEPVDWESLKCYNACTCTDEEAEFVLIGVRRGNLVYLVGSPEGSVGPSEWLVAEPVLDFAASHQLQHLAFYGGVGVGKQEQLVLVVKEDTSVAAYLTNYDDVSFSPLLSSSINGAYCHLDTNILEPSVKSHVTNLRRREIAVRTSAADLQHRVVEQSPRGIVCIVSGGSKLTVIDAEDSGAEEEEDDKGMEDAESDVNEADL